MGAFEAARPQRPYPCCREASNCEALVPDGHPGAGVLARQGERCRVCGRRHFGASLASSQHGVRAGDLQIGGR